MDLYSNLSVHYDGFRENGSLTSVDSGDNGEMTLKSTVGFIYDVLYVCMVTHIARV